jgi:hypothetical protein
MKKVYKSRYLKNISKIITMLLLFILIILLTFGIFVVIYLLISVSLNFINTKLSLCNSNEENYIITILSLFFEFIIFALLNHSLKLIKNIKYYYACINRFIYCKLRVRLNNQLVKNIFIYDYSLYKTPNSSQERVVASFLNNEYDRKILYIIGEKNSGKTGTLYFIMDKGANKSLVDFSDFNCNIIYICKNNSDKQINQFISKYVSEVYKDNIILIDDFVELSDLIKIQIKNKIIIPYSNSKGSYAKSIMILADKNNYYIPKNDSNIIPIEISTPYSYESSNDAEILSLCKKHNITDNNTKIWISEILKNTKGQAVINELLDGKNEKLTDLFLCVLVTCRHSNLVNINIVKRLYLYGIFDFYYNLNLLFEAGIISYFPFYKFTIYFNHNVSDCFFAFFHDNSHYSNKLCDYFESYLNVDIENYSDIWLYYVEYVSTKGNSSGNIGSEYFQNAFLQGNFTYLLEKIQIIIINYPKAELLFYKELGYLNEKVGNRKKAIEYLSEYIKISTSIYDIQQSKLLLFEILHHNSLELVDLQELKSSENDFIKSQAQYWEEHINIEKGKFSYDNLNKILVNYLKHQQCWNNYLNYYHILRRMFSDLARVYFLGENIDHQKFYKLIDLMKNSQLKNYHSEYEEFFNLLTKAHYGHYDIVFQLGFYGHLLHQCIENEYGNNPNINTSVDTALKYYFQCEKAFKDRGDKAWRTVAVRKCELRLTQEIQLINIINELREIKDFFVETNNYLHIAFTDCILCKAIFLNYLRNELDSNSTKTYDKCNSLLKEAEKHYKDFGNEYGLYRIKLINCFLDFFNSLNMHNNSSKNIFIHKLGKLNNEKYPREKEMIEYILDKKSIDSGLINHFFTYYPIILQ